MGSKAIKMKDKNNNTFYPCPYYPIGSIYMNVNNVNPSEYFGGEWEQIKDVFLLCAGDKYIAGSTGGEETHKLTIDEIPSHNHSYLFPRWGTSAGANAIYGSNGSGAGADYDDRFYQGGSQAHNNMPPYLAIYVWQRIA